MTHTPGPWPLETIPTSVGIVHKIGRWPGVHGNAVSSACVYVDNHSLDERTALADELLANARLIAAAPDMLAACIQAHAVLFSDSEPDGWSRETQTMLAAVIAKAEGND